jgi:hypothetical protein
MLTRAKLKLGKGKIVSYKSELEKRLRKKKMASEGGEGENPPMSLEEMMATLRSMRDIIDDLQ